MTINNIEQNVPSQARQLLESVVPFGSNYVVFCSEYSVSGVRKYDVIYNPIVGKKIYHFQVTQNGSFWSQVSEISVTDDYDGFTVSHPYYAYSSIPKEGIFETLPTTSTFICLMLIVCCCLSILRTVFGGVKLWSVRRS